MGVGPVPFKHIGLGLNKENAEVVWGQLRSGVRLFGGSCSAAQAWQSELETWEWPPPAGLPEVVVAAFRGSGSMFWTEA